MSTAKRADASEVAKTVSGKIIAGRTKKSKASGYHSLTKVCQVDLACYERVALVLQGGGALGAYQAGTYEALAEADIHPDWVAGISIGSINSAIIAGNEPGERVAKLRGFWEKITTPIQMMPGIDGDKLRGLFGSFSAMTTMMFGQDGFFKPRQPNPWLQPAGSLAATSYYDTSFLKTTLEQFVDFDRINAQRTRLSVGAVNVRTGNFVYFDNTKRKIGPEHIMASGALPPGFPAVEIDGQFYWDGGLVSNTPLTYVLQDEPRASTLVFQIDLFPASGTVPTDMTQVAERQKDIMFSSRTRANTDAFKKWQQARAAVRLLLDKLSPEDRADPMVQQIEEHASEAIYNIMQLIYYDRSYEGDSKDYEFSRGSMNDRWLAGHKDTTRLLHHPQWFEPPTALDGVSVHDVHRDAWD